MLGYLDKYNCYWFDVCSICNWLWTNVLFYITQGGSCELYHWILDHWKVWEKPRQAGCLILVSSARNGVPQIPLISGFPNLSERRIFQRFLAPPWLLLASWCIHAAISPGALQARKEKWCSLMFEDKVQELTQILLQIHCWRLQKYKCCTSKRGKGHPSNSMMTPLPS